MLLVDDRVGKWRRSPAEQNLDPLSGQLFGTLLAVASPAPPDQLPPQVVALTQDANHCFQVVVGAAVTT